MPLLFTFLISILFFCVFSSEIFAEGTKASGCLSCEISLPQNSPQDLGISPSVPLNRESFIRIGKWNPKTSIEEVRRAIAEVEALLIEKYGKKIEPKAIQRALSFYQENLDIHEGLAEENKQAVHQTLVNGELDPKVQWVNKGEKVTTLADVEKGVRNHQYLMIVDYTKRNNRKRGMFLDLSEFIKAGGEKGVKLYEISIGSKSSPGGAGASPSRYVFSNQSGQNKSVTGIHLTADGVGVHKHPKGRYRAPDLRLIGVEESNNGALRDGKKSHGADYVQPGYAGRSWGCPALSTGHDSKVYEKIKGGGVWYHHYDASVFSADKKINGPASRLEVFFWN